MGCSASVQLREVPLASQPESKERTRGATAASSRSSRLLSPFRKSKASADRPLYDVCSASDFAARFDMQEKIGAGGFATVW